MTEKRRPGESGFSLVELLIAMVVTLIISGAVFGLLSGGQTAFRREPQLTDRQQNIRAAMALIEQDVIKAGVGIDVTLTQDSGTQTVVLQQVFAIYAAADGAATNGHGPQGPLNGTVISGITEGKSDWLELIYKDDFCPMAPVCRYPGNINIFGAGGIPACLASPLPLNVTLLGQTCVNTCVNPPGHASPAHCEPPDPGDKPGTQYTVVDASLGGASIGLACDGHVHVTPPVSGGSWCPYGIVLAPQDIVYQIVVDSQGVPNLYRSGSRGLNSAGAVDPGQLVARGIEDLQVQYQDGNTAPTDSWTAAPQPITVGNSRQNTVRAVKVTLAGRSVDANPSAPSIQGATTVTVATSSSGTTGPVAAVRGQLTSIITPRAALQVLSAASPSPYWQ